MSNALFMKTVLTLTIFSGWLEDQENDVVDRISKRISTFTGLDTNFSAAEEMQVKFSCYNNVKRGTKTPIYIHWTQ